MRPELLDQIPLGQAIASGTADGALDTRRCHDAIAARRAGAVSPISEEWQALETRHPRSSRTQRNPYERHSASGGPSGDDRAAISARAAQRPGCPRRFSRTGGVHRLDVKLLGQRLSARDFDRQIAEYQVGVAVLNGFTAFGTPITEVAT